MSLRLDSNQRKQLDSMQRLIGEVTGITVYGCGSSGCSDGGCWGTCEGGCTGCHTCQGTEKNG